jgi:putative acyl-CoA dehydrogenase
MSEFYVDGPQPLANTYTTNPWLKRYLSWKAKRHFAEFDKELVQLGERCREEYMNLAREAEAAPPVLLPSNEIQVSKAWLELQKIAAREGMIATGYERKYAEYSRVLQFAKLYLFHPSSAFFVCPLAMADGAARVLEVYGKNNPKLTAAFRHLTSRDEKEFWTSGQWMTEKTGGSDVSQTSTIIKIENGENRLYGTKWFSSATTSAMALALARLPDSPAGGKGLSLFYVETHKADGRLNNIEVLRLKDKLGTKALPTAELELKGVPGSLVGEKDQGIKTVATMLNITRLYNSICSCGQMGRALDMLRDYSQKRKVFGQTLASQPLHQMTFVNEELLHLTGFVFTMTLVELLGKEEVGTASDAEKDVLRLLTPVCKLFTGKSAIHVASEVIEGFGGAGYIESSGVAVNLRDAQVFPIWEGATNVLSLDVLRVLQKGNAFESTLKDMATRLKSAAQNSKLQAQAATYSSHVHDLGSKVKALSELKPELIQANMRSLSMYLARLYSGILLVEWAASDAALIAWSEIWMKHNLGEWNVLKADDVSQISSVMTP